jgi:hypothetical protein
MLERTSFSMSDLTDKQWQEYLAKEQRDIMWRALSNIRSAQASFQVTGQEDLYKECDLMAIEVEARLKELYK